MRLPLSTIAGVATLALTTPALAQSGPPDQSAKGAPAEARETVVSVLDLIGRPVVDPTGTRIATVHDMVFATSDGRVRAALAPSGGDTLVSAPTEGLRLRDDGAVVINTDRAGLDALPDLGAAQQAAVSGPGEALLVPGGPMALAAPDGPRPQTASMPR